MAFGEYLTRVERCTHPHVELAREDQLHDGRRSFVEQLNPRGLAGDRGIPLAARVTILAAIIGGAPKLNVWLAWAAERPRP